MPTSTKAESSGISVLIFLDNDSTRSMTEPLATLYSVCRTVTAADPVDSNNGRDEPYEGRQEGKGDAGLELSAHVATGRNVAPIEDSSAVISYELQEDC